MSRHKDNIRLRHMLDHATEAMEMVQDQTYESLEEDRMLELALVRLIEIIGEAAARVSEDTRNRFNQIPWLQITGMRNRLIHGYDQVDLQVLWDTIMDDLPPLVRQLEEALKTP